MAVSYAPRNIKCCLNKHRKGLQNVLREHPRLPRRELVKLATTCIFTLDRALKQAACTYIRVVYMQIDCSNNFSTEQVGLAVKFYTRSCKMLGLVLWQ